MNPLTKWFLLIRNEDILEFTKADKFEAYREKRFSLTDFEIPISNNPAFLLNNTDDFSTLRREYESEQALYYNGQPLFDDVVKTIRNWAINYKI